MRQVRVVIEYTRAGDTPEMRWERQVASENCGTFELLGRAFEVAQREQDEPFMEAIRAFFKGALLNRGDLADVLQRME